MPVVRQTRKDQTVYVRTDEVLLFYSKNRYNPELKDVMDCIRDVLIKSQRKGGRYGRMLEIPSEMSDLFRVVSC